MLYKLSKKNYYNREPYGLIEPGDIFTNLPTMGLLKEDYLSGVIITPACDLANSKTETVTYLPIISIKSWLCSSSFYPEFINHFHALWNQFPELCKSPLSKVLPDQNMLDLLKEDFIQIKSSELGGKRKEIHNKLILCFELIDNIIDDKTIFHNYDNLKTTFPKPLMKIISRIVSNSYSPDLHFLPSENFESKDCYAISQYSLVLFRYPITVPFDVIDMAKDINVSNSSTWDNFIQNCPDKICYQAFKKLPMRGLRLNQDYLSDLLTRYIGLYVRIGSPDFDAITYQEIVNNIELELKLRN